MLPKRRWDRTIRGFVTFLGAGPLLAASSLFAQQFVDVPRNSAPPRGQSLEQPSTNLEPSVAMEDRVASRAVQRPLAPETRVPPVETVDLGLLEQLTAAMRRVVANVRMSVVHIEADKDQGPSGGTAAGPVTEAGSGVVVELRGTRCILTNFHVVRDTPLNSISIALPDGRRFGPSRVVGDAATDVAVLLTDRQDLVPIVIGNSDEVQLGDLVLAFGSPFGLSHSVSHGIVSAKGRRNLDLGIGEVRIQDFIQTDAPINPGNSGGPLMNLRGELVGLNTAIASNSGGNDGIAFSIPSNLAIPTAVQLLQRGRVARPYLGLRLDQNYPGRSKTYIDVNWGRGARVTEVNAGSAAAAAGIRSGDVICRVNREEIEDEAHLRTLIGKLGTPGTCELTVIRDGKTIHLEVALKER